LYHKKLLVYYDIAMSSLITTILIAFVLVVIAVASLAISWLITGKIGIRAGSCGRVPTQKKDEKCGSSQEMTCPLCEKPEDVRKRDS